MCGTKKRKRGDRKPAVKEKAAAVLALMCLGIVAFFLWKIICTQLEYKAGDDVYAQIATMAVTEKEETTDPDNDSAIVEAEKFPTVDFDMLKELNPDIVGWLYSPDTVINYPIVQGSDNDYYLYHLADGTCNRNGCLFVDCKNAGDFSDENTIIYGHHMASGSMFASLVNYASQSYYEAHPFMYLITEETVYRLELFAGYTTTADSDAYVMQFASAGIFKNWMAEICQKSDFLTMTAPTDGDRIVTLSTCAYAFDNARYVVHGRLVKLSEDS